MKTLEELTENMTMFDCADMDFTCSRCGGRYDFRDGVSLDGVEGAMCDECAKNFLNAEWDELTLFEKAKALGFL